MGERKASKLTARQVAGLRALGRYSDGAGVYLVVSRNGRRRWVFRYLSPVTGKHREMGLGGADDVSLAEARRRAAEARALVGEGKDPLQAREAEKPVETFGAYADSFIAGHEVGWRNDKHRAQWRMTLTEYCAPIRDKPVDEIGTDDVLGVLQPLWNTRPETASRLRGRIERVLDYAAALRPGIKARWPGNNPARWRGHLDAILPKPTKLARGHHAALPYQDVPAFLVELRERRSTAARLLEFVVLTACRSGEARLARWGEIDGRGVWSVPAARLKANRSHRPVADHRIPLAPRALEILEEMRAAGNDPAGYIFPGQNTGKPLSVTAMEMQLRRMGRDDVTTHGFRSSFRDWAAETTNFSHEVCEACLAHEIGNKAEAAYRRGDLFEKRRALMTAWADYLTGGGANVLPFPAVR